MSLSRLLAEMNSREIAEWMAYFQVESKLDKGKSTEELKAKFASLAPVKKAKDGKGKNSN